MIVPQNRLLWWFALIALPFSVLTAVYPEAFLVGMTLIGGLVVAATADALKAYGRSDDLKLELPEVVRLSKDRAGEIEARLKNERTKARRIRVGLALPREIQTPAEEQMIPLPSGNDWSRIKWPCTSVKRGHYRLSKVYWEEASPFGLWARRGTLPVNCQVRVYPNLSAERKGLAALFLRRGTFGLHTHRQIGKGREFEKLREYVPGDSTEDIHWKATARRGHPITKVFQIERTQEVYVIVDASRLSARRESATDRGLRTADSRSSDTALERFVTAALILGLAAEQQGDLFGLITFADQVGTFLRARNGQAHYHACRDALYTLEPQSTTPDFDEIATFIRLRLRRRALLVFLTALDDPVLAEGFVRNMDLLCRQHLVLVNMLKPCGADPLFTNSGVSSVDDLYRQLGGHLQWHNLRELEKVLQRRGVHFSLLDREEMSAQLVSEYLNVKQRQLL